ncbi:MAG: metallopeptidase family protein [Proteobacteria bacterium]|nr:metallopeptidase family protein [Pseudomonadota bacterium]
MPPIIAPSLEEFERLADDAWRTIPAALREAAKGVVISVEDFPDEDVCRDMDLESPFELLGLYQGVAINERSVMDGAADIDMVFLFRRPMLDYWCESDEDLSLIVRHVLIHEIGHHFGFSDDDMEALEAEA